MEYPPPPTDIIVGPTLTAYIEYAPESAGAQMIELRLPFIPRIGEILTWGPMGSRFHAEVKNVSWIFTEQDEQGIARIRHVNLHAEPFEPLDDDYDDE